MISFENPTLHLKYFLLVVNPVFKENKQISVTLNEARTYLPSAKIPSRTSSKMYILKLKDLLVFLRVFLCVSMDLSWCTPMATFAP